MDRSKCKLKSIQSSPLSPVLEERRLKEETAGVSAVPEQADQKREVPMRSDLIYSSTDYNKYMIHSMHDWLQNMSPSPYKRLYHRTLLRNWKTLDWAHNNILWQRKTEDYLWSEYSAITEYLWSEYSASDTSNIVQTGRLTAFTCEPLEAEDECQFWKSHDTKMTNKLSCSSRSSDEQHDPNHLLAKMTTFEGSFSSRVLSLHCRNKSLSPLNGISV